MDSFSWTCPFCNKIATITEHNWSINKHTFSKNNKYGDLAIMTYIVICPNTECKEFTVNFSLFKTKFNYALREQEIDGEALQTWPCKPSFLAKVFPTYIPEQIINDYNEACSISALSPKASATLSRRCLQGMIRDFWKISKNRLVDEINELQDKIDPMTWKAISAVRSIGNIGAHMEKDINLIIDVDPKEASMLIGLIEVLLQEWYVRRHDREEQMQKLIEAADEKKALKSGSPL